MFSRPVELATLAKQNLKTSQGGVATLEPTASEEVSELLNQSPFAFESDEFSRLRNLYTSDERGKAPDIGYPRIDMHFLAMRGKRGWPRFGVYSLGEAECVFGVELDTASGMASARVERLIYNFPRPLARHFDRFFQKAAKTALRSLVPFADSSEVTLKVTAPFKGLVPANQRDFIHGVMRDEIVDSIVLVADAPKWEVRSQVVKPTPSPDPLIIGIKDDYTYYLGCFDVTPVEKYVSKEFTS